MATEILSTVQLKKLSEHKYSSHGTSIFEPVMQVFWRWLVEQIPETIAPNAITTAGLVVNAVTSIVLFIYCPTATEEAPVWVYLLCALGLFIYQSLDAIDGKQARRTNSSTPLGELFDHGCDSLSTVFVCISTGCALQLGVYPGWFLYMCCVGNFLYYAAHWQAYVSGTLRFGRFDVTEAQFSVIALYIISAVVGPSFWAVKVPFVGLEMKHIFVIISSIGGFYAGVLYFVVIFSGGIGKNGSTVAGTSIIAPVMHVGTVLLLELMIMIKSPSRIYENHPCLYLLTFGMVSAKVVNKLVVANMTKSEMNYLDTIMIGPALLFFNQYFDTPINEHLLLWIALIISTVDLLRYAVLVCREICNYLGIFCFDITKTKQPADQHKIMTRSQTAKQRAAVSHKQ
ncbi:choline/ethanolaminephosphotransferase 1-like isoform X2 [Ptychodera flava]|uniref:choline/ethanolaminephosphotransferase 1-like isoform X2 n=1 Tax=Ptychodera flava TaxID=63121 RepID=UPI00396A2D68